MGFWDLFVSIVVGGGGGAVLAYIAQTPSEKRLSLFGIRQFCPGLMKARIERSNPGARADGMTDAIPDGFAGI